MPIDMRIIKFDFNNPELENVFGSVEINMPKEMVDNLQATLTEKGWDPFIEALPLSFIGILNWKNHNMTHMTPEVHQIRTKEEFLEYMREEIPDYELSK